MTASQSNRRLVICRPYFKPRMPLSANTPPFVFHHGITHVIHNWKIPQESSHQSQPSQTPQMSQNICS